MDESGLDSETEDELVELDRWEKKPEAIQLTEEVRTTGAEEQEEEEFAYWKSRPHEEYEEFAKMGILSDDSEFLIEARKQQAIHRAEMEERIRKNTRNQQRQRREQERAMVLEGLSEARARTEHNGFALETYQEDLKLLRYELRTYRKEQKEMEQRLLMLDQTQENAQEHRTRIRHTQKFQAGLLQKIVTRMDSETASEKEELYRTLFHRLSVNSYKFICGTHIEHPRSPTEENYNNCLQTKDKRSRIMIVTNTICSQLIEIGQEPETPQNIRRIKDLEDQKEATDNLTRLYVKKDRMENRYTSGFSQRS